MSELCFIYTRVSTKNQVEGDGHARQEEVCFKFIQSKGWTHCVTFAEGGVSGTVPGIYRPQFNALIQRAVANNVKTVIVERSDRLARDLIESELILRECAVHNISIWCADSGQNLSDIESDPTRKLIRQIMSALAEWDRKVIIKKTKAARDRIRAQTGRCEGRKPYDNRDVIKLILDLRREDLKTDAQISDWLNVNCQGASPTGGRWHRRTVQRILKREGVE